MNLGEMRPFQIILLSSFGLLAVIGLFLFANFQGFSGKEKDVGAVVIWGTLPQKAMTDTLTEVRAANRAYSKVSYVERDPNTFDSDLANAIASGSGPDLIIITQEQLITEQSRLTPIPFSSISERTFRDSFLPIFDLFLTDTGSYGLPLVVDPLVLYYNRTLLATVGAARPPATWEAVTGLAPALTRTTDAQTIQRSTIAFGTYENVANARAILSLLLFQAGNTISVRDGAAAASRLAVRQGDSGASASESAVNFYVEFANPSKTTYSWNRSLQSSRQAFITGDLALYPGFASEQKSLALANPNLDFDMAPIPQPGTASIRTTYGRAYAFAIPKAAHNASGAYSVATYLAGRSVGPVIARSLGMAPASRASLTPSSKDLYEPVYYPEALVARGWLSPAPRTTDSIFASMIESISSGRASVKEALGNADASFNAALQ